MSLPNIVTGSYRCLSYGILIAALNLILSSISEYKEILS